jgi:outer membrane biosynthesis protein TonB
MRFGSAQDLSSFVARLESDSSFRDEMASMVRAAIYRERDGFSRLELMELLAMAASGTQADHVALPELREAVRKLMAFIEGVFRTRWNPGAPVGDPAPQLVRKEQGLEVEEENDSAAEAPGASHPMTDIFYRAQVVANGGVAENPPEERMATERVPSARNDRSTENAEGEQQWHIPLADLESSEPGRGSRAWLWIAGACALLLAFSAGLFVHQRMLVPLRDLNQPYEAPPAETAVASTAQPPAANAPSGVHRTGTAVDADWRARAASGRGTGGAGVAARKSGVGTGEPASEADVQPGYVAPGMVGASPALMASYLVYAPPAGYPALAKMTHVQGKVMVEAVVGKNGQVIRAQAISGHRLLRGAAVREVYGRRYRPYLLDDRPRDVATIVSVDFRLK